MLRGIGSDFRYVIRVLKKSPGFTTVAVLSLAIGIGGNAAMFGVVRTLLLTPLPVENPQELSLTTWTKEGRFSLNQVNPSSYTDRTSGVRYRSNFSFPIYQALADAAGHDADLFAFTFLRGVSVAMGDQPALLAGGTLVDGRYFSVLKVRMALGRPLIPADNEEGAPLVTVLSHSFWMRAFGGDPEILGRTVRINGIPAEVVGVTGPGFRGLSKGGFFPQTEITVPLASQPVVESPSQSKKPVSQVSIAQLPSVAHLAVAWGSAQGSQLGVPQPMLGSSLELHTGCPCPSGHTFDPGKQV